MTALPNAPGRMCKPAWSSHSAFYACVGIVTLLGVNCMFLKTLARAFMQQSSADFLWAVGSSAWAQATVADFFCGALVLSFWIGSRTGELVCGFPHAAWAVCVPFLGNPVAAFYLAAAFFQTRDVGAVLVPYEAVPGDSFPGCRLARRAVAATSAFLLLVYCIVLARAVWTEDLVAGFHVLMDAPLVWATFLDNIIGIGCVALIMAFREGASYQLVAWITALALCGHGVSLVYTLLVCAEAETRDTSFGAIWATTSTSLRRQSAFV